MKKISLIIAVLCMMVQLGFAQSLTVTGVVTSKDDGQPVIGASILVKGTTNGTITDFDGNYTITADKGQTLVISYVGMKTQEIVVKNAMQNVVLVTDAEVLEEVVVTAMGVVQEKKTLNFAVQSVDNEAITSSKSSNFVSALQGQISGVSVTNAGGSPNSGSQIIIRGISSVNSSQSNEPLFILDGMPLSGGASSMNDINPNDIENITVLKGAAASALYGQEGANGVIMVTTKRNSSGKVTVTANASLQLDTPMRLIETQMMYGPGALGFYKQQTGGGWGPMLAANAPRYNNVKNYFQNGFYHKYDLNVTGGNDKFQGFASANFSRNDGIVPEDYLQKVGIMLKGTYNISKQVSITMMANVNNNQYRGAGSISSIYSWPINDDITNYKNEDGSIRFRYMADEKANSPISPLWSRYMDDGKNRSLRTMLMGSISYKPIKGLEFTGRISYDSSNYSYDGYSVPRFDDSVVLDDSFLGTTEYLTNPYLTQSQLDKIDKDLLGSYSYSASRSGLLTANVMGSYHLELPKEFNMNFMVGAEARMYESSSSALAGRDFIIPGVYSLSNVSESILNSDNSVGHRQKRNAGVFGEIRGDYKGLASLSVTGRWDWSSTLLYEHNPYFYPSVTAGIIWSEIFGISNNWFNYGKLRGNWAMVGKDAQPYLYDRKFKQQTTFPDGGYSSNPTMSVASSLSPEISTSWEIGLELKFFQNRTRFDVAYYSTLADNQIVTVRVSPSAGHILMTRNEGTVKNHGVEIQFDQDIFRKKNLSWTVGLNIGLNRGVLTKLPEGLVELQGGQYGDIFASAFLGGSTTALTGKDYERTADGQVVVDASGYPKISPTKSVLIGNRESLFSGGINTTFRYKGFSVNMLFDGRLGGDIANVTGRGLWSNGMHKALEQYRGRQVVWDGVVQTGIDEAGNPIYEKNVTPITLDATTISNYYYNVSSNFIEDGSYIRLAHLTLAYDFTDLVKNRSKLTNFKCSLTGTNLFLLTRYTGSNPLANASPSAGGTGAAGVDNYSVPMTRGFNFSLTLGF
ncbi:MAG: SusC/RagA family TonB-linked outer membrane protein [Paludibacteraceae bacterium]|nr:SusC/RagA family TonB-linked outer membrane protein [Paludibacteraceae bacterium]